MLFLLLPLSAKMAINMNSGDSCPSSSPRLSFSHDLPDQNPTRNYQEVETTRLEKSLPLETVPDFDFCVPSFPDETKTCLADELFFNGVIIPTQMREKLNQAFPKEADEEITSTTTATLVREEKSQSKSFWRFGRSSSLNCDNNKFDNCKKSSVWSLPHLLRSKSTGSTNEAKKSYKTGSFNSKSVKFSPNNVLLPPHHHKVHPKRHIGNGNGNNCNYNYNYDCNYNYNYNYNYSKVLKVPRPYIAKGTSDLLGLGGLFRNRSSKEKKGRK